MQILTSKLQRYPLLNLLITRRGVLLKDIWLVSINEPNYLTHQELIDLRRRKSISKTKLGRRNFAYQRRRHITVEK